ncbi:hypothetical protein ACIBCR_16335 [Micromonospora echinospora]|uniref:hypothetical protein n=1 Tax=Micromonospora echinospora TaxID=1877 RepID=UPI0037AA6BB2
MRAIPTVRVLRYDGTNSADILTDMPDYQLVAETDEVLTVAPVGGQAIDITADHVVVGGIPVPEDYFQANYYVVPEPTP